MLQRLTGGFRWISHITLLLSAFLLFISQPLITKFMLPYFGGGGAIWSVSLLFFTTVLLLGYLYAHAIAKLPLARGAHRHLVVVGTLGVITIIEWIIFQTPLFPSTGVMSTLGISGHPQFMLLASLLLAIGIPYFLLSTTSTLVQHWYGQVAGVEVPYRLYALSNAASLLGLLMYPFLIETQLFLHAQAFVWGVGFVIYLFLLAAVTAVVTTHRSTHGNVSIRVDKKAPRESFLRWIALSILPAALLVSLTSTLSRGIAPIPLFWIVPLVLYLSSFIVVFRGFVPGRFSLAAICLLGVPLLFFSLINFAHPLVIGLYLLVYFLIACVVHGALYQSRPEKSLLSSFYLALSIGGALGTLFGSIIAPLIFVIPHEFHYEIVAGIIFALHLLRPLRVVNASPVQENTLVWAAMLVMIIAIPASLSQKGITTVDLKRNFYGALRVVDQFDERTSSTSRVLLNGTITHGTQFMEPALQRIPTAYFAPGSGVGRAITHLQGIGETKESMSVGIIGLGAGTLAAYCRPSDQYVFYEIDPAVIEVAEKDFTYLSQCPNIQTIDGDARLKIADALTHETSPLFDVFVVDAFSDDAIPVHLLTKEAFTMYGKLLKDDDSVLAVHISNRYLNLAPIVFAGALTIGLDGAFVVYNPKNDAPEDRAKNLGGTLSFWVILSKNKSTTDAVRYPSTDGVEQKAKERPLLWSDDYSNLFSVITGI